MAEVKDEKASVEDLSELDITDDDDDDDESDMDKSDNTASAAAAAAIAEIMAANSDDEGPVVTEEKKEEAATTTTPKDNAAAAAAAPSAETTTTTTSAEEGTTPTVPETATTTTTTTTVDESTTTTSNTSTALSPHSSILLEKVESMRLALHDTVAAVETRWRTAINQLRQRKAEEAAAAAATTAGIAKAKEDSEPKDVFAETDAEAIEKLKELILRAKEHNLVVAAGSGVASTATSSNTPTATELKNAVAVAAAEEENMKWDFPYTPLDEFKASVDDVLLAFCKWASCEIDVPTETDAAETATTTETEQQQSSSASEESSKQDEQSPSQPEVAASPAAATTTTATTTKKTVLNITKAFERLDAYVNWMYQNQDKLHDLTAHSIAPTAFKMGMKLTHSAKGSFVWWMDLNDMDLEAVKTQTIPPEDVVRFVVWASHLAMFDSNARENGVIIIQNAANVGLWKSLTTIPKDVLTSMDKLTVGCLPLRVEGIYVINAAIMVKFLVKAMKVFMSQKMSNRIVILGPRDDPKYFIFTVLGGPTSVLNGCCGMSGTIEHDILFGTYLKQTIEPELEAEAEAAEDSKAGETETATPTTVEVASV